MPRTSRSDANSDDDSFILRTAAVRAWAEGRKSAHSLTLKYSAPELDTIGWLSVEYALSPNDWMRLENALRELCAAHSNPQASRSENALRIASVLFSGYFAKGRGDNNHYLTQTTHRLQDIPKDLDAMVSAAWRALKSHSAETPAAALPRFVATSAPGRPNFTEANL